MSRTSWLAGRSRFSASTGKLAPVWGTRTSLRTPSSISTRRSLTQHAAECSPEWTCGSTCRMARKTDREWGAPSTLPSKLCWRNGLFRYSSPTQIPITTTSHPHFIFSSFIANTQSFSVAKFPPNPLYLVHWVIFFFSPRIGHKSTSGHTCYINLALRGRSRLRPLRGCHSYRPLFSDVKTLHVAMSGH